MIPARVALALQADGWWLRSDIVWSKPNPMPESVTDRPTKSHEYIFLLTKIATYFYDAEAVKEPGSTNSHGGGKIGEHRYSLKSGRNDGGSDFNNAKPAGTSGRNRRSVWTVPTAPYPGAHFACFPPAIPHLCILAGTSAKGCCPQCGSPWARIVEDTGIEEPSLKESPLHKGKSATHQHGRASSVERTIKRAIGWQPTCTCNAGEPVPCTVLDPFAGSGTTLAVALELGRNAIGIELNPDYEPLIRKRIARTDTTINIL